MISGTTSRVSPRRCVQFTVVVVTFLFMLALGRCEHRSATPRFRWNLESVWAGKALTRRTPFRYPMEGTFGSSEIRCMVRSAMWSDKLRGWCTTRSVSQPAKRASGIYEYVVKHDTSDDALSYFSPTDPTHWYWALDGFYANGDLWVTLLCIHPPRSQRRREPISRRAALIWRRSPTSSETLSSGRSPFTVVPDGVKAYPSAAAVVNDGYAYLFAHYEKGTHPRPRLAFPSKSSRHRQLRLNTLRKMGPGSAASIRPRRTRS